MFNSSNQMESVAYDQWHEAIHGGENFSTIKLDDWHKNALSLSPFLKNLKVLEVGCGVGDFSIYLSTQQADITGVDFSSTAINIAIQKAEFQNKLVNFKVADAQELPFPSHSFDVVFSCECLEHLPDPKRAISEFYRVLKPSGKLILTTENYSNALLLIWLMCWLKKKPFNSGVTVQPIEHFFVFWNVKKMFELAGFKVTKMIGSHHIFLLLPRFHPWTFVKDRFQNPIAAALFFPLARHITFHAIKNIE